MATNTARSAWVRHKQNGTAQITPANAESRLRLCKKTQHAVGGCVGTERPVGWMRSVKEPLAQAAPTTLTQPRRLLTCMQKPGCAFRRLTIITLRPSKGLQSSGLTSPAIRKERPRILAIWSAMRMSSIRSMTHSGSRLSPVRQSPHTKQAASRLAEPFRGGGRNSKRRSIPWIGIPISLLSRPHHPPLSGVGTLCTTECRQRFAKRAVIQSALQQKDIS